MELKKKAKALREGAKAVRSMFVLRRGAFRTVMVVAEEVCVKTINGDLDERHSRRLSTIDALFGIKDINRYELENYRRYFSKMSGGLDRCFARIFCVVDNQSYMEAVKDFDGSISRNLAEHGRVNSPSFWNLLLQIRDFAIQNRILMFDPHANNVLVKRLDGTQSIPVYIDYKWMGPQAFPGQPWLWIPKLAEMKVRRKFNGLVRDYAPRAYWASMEDLECDPSKTSSN